MVLFSSVTAFIESVGRQRKTEKRDMLDTLTRIYTGPTAFVDSFIPANGTADSQYSLMTVLSATATDLGHGSGVSEVTVNYHGKLASGSRYTSAPTISTSWSEGEVSYTQLSGNTSSSISHRYTGRNVAIAYITNFRPTGNPSNLGLAKGYLGFTNEFEVVTGVSTGTVSSYTPGYFTDMRCTDIKIDDLADGWYKVTETYQSRIFPMNALNFAAGSAGKMFYQTKITDPVYPPDSVGTQDAYYQQTAAIIDQYAGAAAATAGAPLDRSPIGSVGADTAQKTGQDPIWPTDTQQQASSADPSGGGASDLGAVSPDVSGSGSGIGDS